MSVVFISCCSWKALSELNGELAHRRAFLARVNADGLEAQRILAIERDTKLQALTVEALNDLLAKYRKRARRLRRLPKQLAVPRIAARWFRRRLSLEREICRVLDRDSDGW
jgi:hypothetical protein